MHTEIIVYSAGSQSRPPPWSWADNALTFARGLCFLQNRAHAAADIQAAGGLTGRPRTRTPGSVGPAPSPGQKEQVNVSDLGFSKGQPVFTGSPAGGGCGRAEGKGAGEESPSVRPELCRARPPASVSRTRALAVPLGEPARKTRLSTREHHRPLLWSLQLRRNARCAPRGPC